MGGHETFVILGLVIGGALALAGLFRPFLGLLVLTAIHFIQPGELVRALNVISIERSYAIALLLVFVIHRLSTPGRPLLSNRLVLASLLLVGSAFLSIPFAVWRGGAFEQTIELIKNVILLVLIFGLVDTNARMSKVLWLMVGLFAWFAGSALITYSQGQFAFAEGIERAEGINSMAGGPNELAGLILAFFPFLIALLRSTHSILIRLLLLACGSLGLAALVLTGARAAMIALIIVGAYYVLRSRHKIAWLLACVALASIIWIGMPQSYRDRYLTVKQYALGGQLDASNEFRLRIWKAGWRMLLDHPLLGVGAGQFPTAFGTTYAGRAHIAWMNPHNLFLQVACELGIVGLIVFIYFVIQIVKQIRHLPRRESNPLVELNFQVATACGAMLIGVMAMSVVSHTLYRPYWYLLGGLVAANSRNAWAAFEAEVETDVGGAGEETVSNREDTLENVSTHWGR
jgi:O-antigen ligase